MTKLEANKLMIDKSVRVYRSTKRDGEYGPETFIDEWTGIIKDVKDEETFLVQHPDGSLVAVDIFDIR